VMIIKAYRRSSCKCHRIESLAINSHKHGCIDETFALPLGCLFGRLFINAPSKTFNIWGSGGKSRADIELDVARAVRVYIVNCTWALI
jgi:hypothetical protein